MAAKNGRASQRRPALPPMDVARVMEAQGLLEQLVVEKADLFLAAQQHYREQHAAVHPPRPLDAVEAAQVAAAMVSDGDPVELAERVQASGLRAQDRPAPQEMLAVAGVSTSRAFIEAGVRLLALLRLPAAEFAEARRAGTLDEVIAVEVEKIEALGMREARAQAAEAFKHFLTEAGFEGNGLGLIGQAIRQAFGMAMQTMGPDLDRLTSSSLTGSPPPTPDPGPLMESATE